MNHLFIFGCAESSLLSGLFSSCGEWGLLSYWGAQASHCSDFSCCGTWALGRSGFGSYSSRAPEHMCSVVVAHGLSCSATSEIVPDQRSNLCPLHWQVGSLPSSLQGSPHWVVIDSLIEVSIVLYRSVSLPIKWPNSSSYLLGFFLFILSFVWLHWALVAAHGIFSCGMWDLVPWPGIKPGPPALRIWSLSHWTTREVCW